MKRYISCNESADSMDMVDFYRITTYEDGRYIEPEFYFYYADDGTDTPGRCVWYHRIIKLEDFIAMDNNAKLDNLAEIVKYVDDLTEEETDTGYPLRI